MKMSTLGWMAVLCVGLYFNAAEAQTIFHADVNQEKGGPDWRAGHPQGTYPVLAKAEATAMPIQEDCGCMGKTALQGRNIFLNGSNLSLKRFMEYYSSPKPVEQNIANAFLLGVVDATEGKIWCDYRLLKTVSIEDFLSSRLKETSRSMANERAAYVISHILEKAFPCQKETRAFQ